MGWLLRRLPRSRKSRITIILDSINQLISELYPFQYRNYEDVNVLLYVKSMQLYLESLRISFSTCFFLFIPLLLCSFMYVINRVSYFKIKIFGTFLWLYILGIFFEETLRISHRISITCGSIAKVNVNINIIIVPEKVIKK